ncbi:MAG: SSU ribosomal protein S6P modification protein [halophilic archaeon J07HX64]|jgi:SSU ribosomal protein S6P modification protein|nr:MAG: SSU ribosomal protein S6P modification protein [halophilic archaeon J07HX64]
MLRLAVTTRAETYERMQEPLADRSIAVEHVPTTERTLTPDDDLDGFDVGFVFPPRLAEGGVADALLGVPWVNGREDVLRSRYKGETLARLSQAGVPTPETAVVSDPVDEAQLRAAFDRFDPPVVVKPNSATRGVGVTTAGDLDSFLGICDYLDLVHDYRATGDCSFLVQEYLPEARDYRAMVVDGDCVGAVERRIQNDPETDRDESRQMGVDTTDPETAHSGVRPSEADTTSPGAGVGQRGPTGRWKHNVHRGAVAQGVDLPTELRDLAESAAAALDVPWLGVDLLVTDGRAVVNETNARPTIDTADKYRPGFWDTVATLVRQTA